MKSFFACVSMLCVAVFALAGSSITRCTNVDPVSSAVESPTQPELQRGTLCSRDETVVFSCPAKRTAKIISLCSSTDLDKTQGYIQYRYGLPAKTELEFPKDKQGSQKEFYYAHYFRAQFDQTEISFNNGDFNYRIFDYYQGEEKPATHTQGLIVTPPSTKRSSTTIECATSAKADYGNLGEVLPCDPDSTISPGGCN
jgi:hypothetical protein